MKFSLLVFIFFIVITNMFIIILNIKENKVNKIELDVMSKKFSDIYKYHRWIRGSGRGSDKECTEEYRIYLKKIISQYKVNSIVDYGCGDWKMLSSFVFDNSITYVGYDIVKSVIEENKRKYSKKNIIFYQINNSLDNLIKGDLLTIKDVFQHWNNENILSFIRNILPRYKYSLITNTYNYSNNNKNIDIGKCRSLDLEEHPFNLHFISKNDMYFCGELKRIYLYMS